MTAGRKHRRIIRVGSRSARSPDGRGVCDGVVVARPSKGFGGGAVLEVVEDHDGDTYRGVYTVKFEDIVYALHAFQKKSKQGSATPQADMDLVKRRLKVAEADHRERQKRKASTK